MLHFRYVQIEFFLFASVEMMEFMQDIWMRKYSSVQKFEFFCTYHKSDTSYAYERWYSKSQKRFFAGFDIAQHLTYENRNLEKRNIYFYIWVH